MLKLKEAIIVEGIYDKMKLGKLVETIIVATNGFSIFKNNDKIKLIKKLADEKGIIVLTDSDRAGFTIRNFIKSFVPAQSIKHAYIPEIEGKEKRKIRAGKEGILGVEGLSDGIIRDVLVKAGYCHDDSLIGNQVTKLDLYKDGLYGKPSSKSMRSKMLAELDLPSKLETNALIQILNNMLIYEDYKALCKKISL